MEGERRDREGEKRDEGTERKRGEGEEMEWTVRGRKDRGRERGKGGQEGMEGTGMEREKRGRKEEGGRGGENTYKERENMNIYRERLSWLSASQPSFGFPLTVPTSLLSRCWSSAVPGSLTRSLMLEDFPPSWTCC